MTTGSGASGSAAIVMTGADMTITGPGWMTGAVLMTAGLMMVAGARTSGGTSMAAGDPMEAAGRIVELAVGSTARQGTVGRFPVSDPVLQRLSCSLWVFIPAGVIPVGT